MVAWSFDSRRLGRGEARLEVGEGGGRVWEGAHARNRGMVAGGRKSKGGGGGRTSSARLCLRKREREQGE